jgi:hypothetical protein
MHDGTEWNIDKLNKYKAPELERDGATGQNAEGVQRQTGIDQSECDKQNRP